MKSITKLTTIRDKHIQQIATQLEHIMPKEDLEIFVKYQKAQNKFGARELGSVWLVAELTIEGNGTIQNLIPNCWVEQEDCFYELAGHEIEPIYIPLKSVLVPQTPFEISGSETFLVVLESEKSNYFLYTQVF